MRICIDARSLTDPQPTGVGLYTFHITKALLEQYPEHDWVLFSSGRHSSNAPLLQHLREQYNVQHTHLQWPNKRFHAQGAIFGTPSITDVVGGADVVFAPNVHILPVDSTVPVVLTVHDISYALYPQYLSLQRALWHRVVRPAKCIARANQVVAVSTTTQHDVQRVFGVEDDRIRTVYSGIPQPLEFLDERIDVQHPLPDAYMVFVSTIEPRKNIAAVIDAFAQYRDEQLANNQEVLPLVVVGSAGWKSTDVLKRMLKESHVHYVGYVNSITQQCIVEQASMLLYPSIYEGFGFPPLEALQAGVPVIASQAGALPEILGNAAVYVDPYVVKDITRAMHTLQDEAAVRTRIISDGKVQVQKYRWNEAAQRMMETFHLAVK